MAICFDIYHHPRILVIIFLPILFSSFLHIYVHSVLHVINYGINKIYFLMTVSNVILLKVHSSKSDNSIANINRLSQLTIKLLMAC